MSLIITKNHVVTLAYSVTTPDGDVVDKGEEPLVYLHGDYGDLFPKIEESLEGKKVGDKLDIDLEPADAFGDYDDTLVKVESRELFSETIQVGDEVEAEGDEIIYQIAEIEEDKVVLEGNHPLAGLALVFHVAVSDVREASHEEITHGHVHMPGHHH